MLKYLNTNKRLIFKKSLRLTIPQLCKPICFCCTLTASFSFAIFYNLILLILNFLLHWISIYCNFYFQCILDWNPIALHQTFCVWNKLAFPVELVNSAHCKPKLEIQKCFFFFGWNNKERRGAKALRGDDDGIQVDITMKGDDDGYRVDNEIVLWHRTSMAVCLNEGRQWWIHGWEGGCVLKASNVAWARSCASTIIPMSHVEAWMNHVLQLTAS